MSWHMEVPENGLPSDLGLCYAVVVPRVGGEIGFVPPFEA
jgi:hypothetical protein